MYICVHTSSIENWTWKHVQFSAQGSMNSTCTLQRVLFREDSLGCVTSPSLTAGSLSNCTPGHVENINQLHAGVRAHMVLSTQCV